MTEIISALSEAIMPMNLFAMALGTLVGILCGAMPGLSSIMVLSIMTPFTFVFPGNTGILMLLGVFCGAIYGGSITAILINTPGTANSAATCLDGYPMAKSGQPGRALSISTTASTFGGLFYAFALFFTAPILAAFALKFQAPEYFALGIFGLSIVTGVSSNSVRKGITGAVIGLALSMVGMDSISGQQRFTFHHVYLMGGISYIPLLIGVYAFAQGLTLIEERAKHPTVATRKKAKLERVLPTRSDLKTIFPTVLMSAIIGTIIGAIPGTGGDIASWFGYTQAKRMSKHKELFGKGAPQGIAAPESANNAVSGGALIPLLTLGIPGDAGSAVMLGALMMQGIIPGPLLFSTQTHQVYVIIIGLILANICMCLMGFMGIRGFSKVSNLPDEILIPIVFVFCSIGTFCMNHNMDDILFMVIAGVIGYFLIKMDYAMPPVILGLILGPTIEKNLQKSLVISDGSFAIFFTHPISCVLLIIAVFSLGIPFFSYLIHKKQEEKKAVAG
jgi:putative tricarboxylic transport membrane protein